ncbi:hypothetical protein TH25_13935 [Thalassospira profundimaris]|uniref:Uncharacterized protein n=1 Tax=Thalassospira profundimaris TaxID=502049 RepID=A0A367X536_9PROT|nr:hypothetical protein [Thalassospira profundimaris]RCK48697.1 hypothetical protein TH25_13935 [Thalassospira profundimaris]
MEQRDQPERGPQDVAPSAYVSNRRIQEARRVVSPARRSSMNRYDRPEVIEQELETKKAAAIERLAAKGITVTRIGPEPATRAEPNPNQYVWETSAPRSDPELDQTAGSELANGAFEWKVDGAPAQRPAEDIPTNTVPGNDGLEGAGESPDMATQMQTEHVRTDDLLSRFTQEPKFPVSAFDANPDLTSMAIEQHGLRLPDRQPGTPRPPKREPSEPVDQMQGGRRRATPESYAALESLAARAPKKPEPPQRKGVEFWAPRIGAYMIAAVAVGYVVVLTAIELYSLF